MSDTATPPRLGRKPLPPEKKRVPLHITIPQNVKTKVEETYPNISETVEALLRRKLAQDGVRVAP